MSKTKKYLFEIIIMFVGFAFLAFGISFILSCGLGSDPISVFIDGISHVIKTSFGIAHISVTLTFLIIVLALKRRYINIATIISVFSIGPLIDLFTPITQSIVTPSDSLYVRVPLLIVAIVIFSFGIAVYISANLGAAPADVFAEIVNDSLEKVPYKYIRIAIDGTFVIVGFLIGGICGVGTIVSVVLIGPFVQFFKGYAGKFHNSLVG